MSDDAIREAIDHFLGYFASECEAVAHIQVPSRPQQTANLYRQMLYFLLIDALSKAAFPTMHGNRKRFIGFLDSCSGWAYRERVSAPQLQLVLEKAGLKDGKLYQEACRRVASWAPGAVINPAEDPLIGELLPISRSQESQALEQCRYVPFLYSYRNNLVHEFRKSGYGMDDDRDEPSYLSFINAPWQMNITNRFLDKLVNTSLFGLGNLLREQKRDPHEAYGFGSIWKIQT